MGLTIGKKERKRTLEYMQQEIARFKRRAAAKGYPTPPWIVVDNAARRSGFRLYKNPKWKNKKKTAKD